MKVSIIVGTIVFFMSLIMSFTLVELFSVLQLSELQSVVDLIAHEIGGDRVFSRLESIHCFGICLTEFVLQTLSNAYINLGNILAGVLS